MKIAIGVGSLLLAVFGTSLVPGAADAAPSLEVEVLSSRPTVVSGGDALVRVRVPSEVSVSDVRVEVEGTDVTSDFRTGERTLEGVVGELELGANTITASAPSTESGKVTVQNHPRIGPVLSGPHEEPFICDTSEFVTVTGETLGAPLDENCSVETRVDYVYRTRTGETKPLPADDPRPEDLAWTTTTQGSRVPYIIRVETGTINRGIYEISMLHDPNDPEPDPWQRSKGWNDRLIYTFGGGCTRGWYVQGRDTGYVMDDVMLRRGYAVASSSLNVFGNNCNDLLAAETTSMVKERFVEAYGEPQFTIGWGCSGGSYQTHQIADNYPGLLDGIIAGCSFPDVGFGTINTITDARLLNHFFTETAPDEFTEEQQRAVAGFGNWESIENLAEGGGRIDPRIFCPDQLPEELRYDPEENPDGARCDVYDHTVNVYGRDEDTGFARRPLDNNGIQYGLEALQNKTIDVDQFLDLNDGIGGFDVDANYVSDRTTADPDATEQAYRTGRLLNGGGGLADTPIIDYRAYSDDLDGGDIHMRFQSFSTRERLEKANGTYANQVMLVEDNRYGGFSTESPVVRNALAQMDEWLSTGDRPRSLRDACWTRDEQPRKITEPQVEGIETTECNTLYPVWPSPRMVAGGPTANDIVKCQLRPIDFEEYGVEFTDPQRRRLAEIFPNGVCDWSKPGIGQQDLAGTWLTF